MFSSSHRLVRLLAPPPLYAVASASIFHVDPPFESWMYFEDFQEFFDFVTIYRDPAMFKHQTVFHRGRNQPETTPVDRRLRKKKTISRPKSSRLMSGSNSPPQVDTVRMVSNAVEPTALLVTFSAFGSKEKFLDGSKLPPGLLTVSVVDPFGDSREVRAGLAFWFCSL